MTIGYSDGNAYEDEFHFLHNRLNPENANQNLGTSPTEKAMGLGADIQRRRFAVPQMTPEGYPYLQMSDHESLGPESENIEDRRVGLRPLNRAAGHIISNATQMRQAITGQEKGVYGEDIIKDISEPGGQLGKQLGKDILIIRHGATDFNEPSGGEKNDEYIRGHLNPPLNEKGRQQAEDLAQKLKDVGIQRIVTSDLSRAQDTAARLAETTGAQLYMDTRLRPWDLGDFQGQKLSACKPQIDNYCLNRPDDPVPNGESFNVFRKRASDALIDAAQAGMDAVVTHHRVDRLEASHKDDGFAAKEMTQKGEETGVARTVDRQDMVQRLAQADNRYYFIPERGKPGSYEGEPAGEGEGFWRRHPKVGVPGNWPLGQVDAPTSYGSTYEDTGEYRRPTEEEVERARRFPYFKTVADEMRDRTEAAEFQSFKTLMKGMSKTYEDRINKVGWSAWLNEAPESSNIQDRREGYTNAQMIMEKIQDYLRLHMDPSQHALTNFWDVFDKQEGGTSRRQMADEDTLLRRPRASDLPAPAPPSQGAAPSRVSSPEQITNRTMDLIKGIQDEPTSVKSVGNLNMGITKSEHGTITLNFKDKSGKDLGYISAYPTREGRDLKVSFAQRYTDYSTGKSAFSAPAKRGGKSILEGSGKMPEMIELIKQEFPNVERIYGTRVSGILGETHGMQFIRIREPQGPVQKVETKVGSFEVPEDSLERFNHVLNSKFYSKLPRRQFIDYLRETGAERAF